MRKKGIIYFRNPKSVSFSHFVCLDEIFSVYDIEDLKKESTRANFEGLTEEELELFDLLIKDKKLTKAEEQSVKLAAKSIYSKLTEEKSDLFVVDWYKDEQPKLKVKQAIEQVLDEDLPDCYDKEIFAVKTNLLLNHFIDMTVQHYGWVCA